MSTSNVATFQPAINITVTGLVAIFVSPDKKKGLMGLLRNTPMGHPHHHIIQTIEYDSMNNIHMSHQGVLSVPHVLEVTPASDISFRKPDAVIKRQEGPSADNADSFKWAVDIEGHDFYDKPIGAREAGFYPFLSFNSGELYTAEISTTKLDRIDPAPKGQNNFGFVAVRIGIYIPLDQGVSAQLKNGYWVVFNSRLDRRYDIIVDHGPMVQPSGVITDADTYYEDDAIGGNLSEAEKIHFQSPARGNLWPFAGPEAACFEVYMGQSWPS